MTSLGDAFRVVVDHTGWSGSRLARELGAAQPWVSMVLNGRRDPGVRRSAELLARAGWELQLVPRVREEEPVKRREFILGAAAVMFVPTPAANPYASAEYVHRLAVRLAHNEAQMGGAPLAREALRHVNRITSTAGGSRDAALLTAASRLCRRAALVFHDVRQLGRAEETAAAALRFAHWAAQPAAQADAYDTLSLITAHVSDGRGAEYARRGLALAGVDGPERAMLSARLGRSLALHPDARYDARTSFDRALDLVSGADSDFSADVTGNVGIGLTDLGLTAVADPHLATAVDLTAGSPFLHALYVARQAKTAIRARDPEAVAHRMTALTALAPLVDSPRLRVHERHILDGTARWAPIHAVRDAREALREVTR